MKVLFLATVMSHLKAFHEPYMEWFQSQGWEVHAAGKEDADLRFCDKKYFLPIERSPFQAENIKAGIQLKKIIEKENYDIIHCHTPMGGVLARLAAAGARKHGTKVIYTAHGFHFYKGAPLVNWLVYYPIERLLANVTDVLITINHEDYERAKNFPAKRVLYVPGVGIDIDRFKINDRICIDSETEQLSEEELERACLQELFFKSDEEEKQHIGSRRKQLRKEFGIEDEEIMLLSVGELISRKNHVLVLEALAELRDLNIQYVICGTGPSEEMLKQKIKQLGLDNVILAGHRDDIPEICHAADIFVFPSLQEGLPVALMEAMAAGLPVAASRIRGNTDLITHKKNGYLLSNRKESYEKAIRLLAKSKKRRDTFGQAAKETVKEYSLETVKKKMVEIYKSFDKTIEKEK
jgi:glycosyltransferase EpsD